MCEHPYEYRLSTLQSVGAVGTSRNGLDTGTESRRVEYSSHGLSLTSMTDSNCLCSNDGLSR